MNFAGGGDPGVVGDANGASVSRAQLSIRAALRADGVRAIIADVVAAECGAAPHRARRDSLAWKAHCAGITYLAESLDAWRRVALPEEPAPDLHAFAFVAANRACWAVLEGVEAQRARLRSQVRCIFARTPGYALWRASCQARRRSGWLVGQVEWRDQDLSAKPLSIPAGRRDTLPVLGPASTFDDVQAAALALVDRADAPIAVESLVSALSPDPGGIGRTEPSVIDKRLSLRCLDKDKQERPVPLDACPRLPRQSRHPRKRNRRVP